MGKVHDDERTFIAHLGFYGEYDTTCQSTGGLTIAYKLEDGNVRVGIAECSMLDRYNRELGRTIATGRLEKKPIVLNMKSVHTPNILSRILHSIMFRYPIACKEYTRKLGTPLSVNYRRGGHYVLTVWPDGETSYDTVSDC
jgi:hypothetical protein